MKVQEVDFSTADAGNSAFIITIYMHVAGCCQGYLTVKFDCLTVVLGQQNVNRTVACSVVVSLGCGRYKEKPFSGCSIYSWKSPGDLLRDTVGVVEILKVMADQVCV